MVTRTEIVEAAVHDGQCLAAGHAPYRDPGHHRQDVDEGRHRDQCPDLALPRVAVDPTLQLRVEAADPARV